MLGLQCLPGVFRKLAAVKAKPPADTPAYAYVECGAGRASILAKKGRQTNNKMGRVADHFGAANPWMRRCFLQHPFALAEAQVLILDPDNLLCHGLSRGGGF